MARQDVGQDAPSDSELLDALACSVARRGLSTPVAAFLELLKPLSFVGRQVLLLIEPLLGPFAGTASRRYARLLEDGRGVERLLERLDERSGALN